MHSPPPQQRGATHPAGKAPLMSGAVPLSPLLPSSTSSLSLDVGERQSLVRTIIPNSVVYSDLLCKKRLLRDSAVEEEVLAMAKGRAATTHNVLKVLDGGIEEEGNNAKTTALDTPVIVHSRQQQQKALLIGLHEPFDTPNAVSRANEQNRETGERSAASSATPRPKAGERGKEGLQRRLASDSSPPSPVKTCSTETSPVRVSTGVPRRVLPSHTSPPHSPPSPHHGMEDPEPETPLPPHRALNSKGETKELLLACTPMGLPPSEHLSSLSDEETESTEGKPFLLSPLPHQQEQPLRTQKEEVLPQHTGVGSQYDYGYNGYPNGYNACPYPYYPAAGPSYTGSMQGYTRPYYGGFQEFPYHASVPPPGGDAVSMRTSHGAFTPPECRPYPFRDEREGDYNQFQPLPPRQPYSERHLRRIEDEEAEVEAAWEKYYNEQAAVAATAAAQLGIHQQPLLHGYGGERFYASPVPQYSYSAAPTVYPSESRSVGLVKRRMQRGRGRGSPQRLPLAEVTETKDTPVPFTDCADVTLTPSDVRIHVNHPTLGLSDLLEEGPDGASGSSPPLAASLGKATPPSLQTREAVGKEDPCSDMSRTAPAEPDVSASEPGGVESNSPPRSTAVTERKPDDGVPLNPAAVPFCVSARYRRRLQQFPTPPFPFCCGYGAAAARVELPLQLCCPRHQTIRIAAMWFRSMYPDPALSSVPPFGLPNPMQATEMFPGADTLEGALCFQTPSAPLLNNSLAAAAVLEEQLHPNVPDSALASKHSRKMKKEVISEHRILQQRRSSVTTAAQGVNSVSMSRHWSCPHCGHLIFDAAPQSPDEPLSTKQPPAPSTGMRPIAVRKVTSAEAHPLSSSRHHPPLHPRGSKVSSAHRGTTTTAAGMDTAEQTFPSVDTFSTAAQKKMESMSPCHDAVRGTVSPSAGVQNVSNVVTPPRSTPWRRSSASPSPSPVRLETSTTVVMNPPSSPAAPLPRHHDVKFGLPFFSHQLSSQDSPPPAEELGYPLKEHPTDHCGGAQRCSLQQSNRSRPGLSPSEASTFASTPTVSVIPLEVIAQRRTEGGTENQSGSRDVDDREASSLSAAQQQQMGEKEEGVHVAWRQTTVESPSFSRDREEIAQALTSSPPHRVISSPSCRTDEANAPNPRGTDVTEYSSDNAEGAEAISLVNHREDVTRATIPMETYEKGKGKSLSDEPERRGGNKEEVVAASRLTWVEKLLRHAPTPNPEPHVVLFAEPAGKHPTSSTVLAKLANSTPLATRRRESSFERHAARSSSQQQKGREKHPHPHKDAAGDGGASDDTAPGRSSDVEGDRRICPRNTPIASLPSSSCAERHGHEEESQKRENEAMEKGLTALSSSSLKLQTEQRLSCPISEPKVPMTLKEFLDGNFFTSVLSIRLPSTLGTPPRSSIEMSLERRQCTLHIRYVPLGMTDTELREWLDPPQCSSVLYRCRVVNPLATWLKSSAPSENVQNGTPYKLVFAEYATKNDALAVRRYIEKARRACVPGEHAKRFENPSLVEQPLYCQQANNCIEGVYLSDYCPQSGKPCTFGYTMEAMQALLEEGRLEPFRSRVEFVEEGAEHGHSEKSRRPQRKKDVAKAHPTPLHKKKKKKCSVENQTT